MSKLVKAALAYVSEAAAWRRRGGAAPNKDRKQLWLWKMKTHNFIRFHLRLPAGTVCRVLMRGWFFGPSLAVQA